MKLLCLPARTFRPGAQLLTGTSRLRPGAAAATLAAAFVLGAACLPALGQSFFTNTYTVFDEDFANPERGFYVQASTKASARSAVPSNLASYRTSGKSSPGNTYTAKISLVLRLFYLDSFTNAPISSNFLYWVQTDFDSIRAQGAKAIVRFAYTQNDTRPFGEPSKARILEHIGQLKPLLQQNSDVIAVLQQGLIGAWGEGYYTDIFYTDFKATTQNWLDRTEVLSALLDALPPERMVQVRIPQLKQKFVYGPAAPTSSAPLSSAAAFSGAYPARIGFHNDCYLASSTDYGTFSDYDSGGTTSQQDTTNLRNYLALESRYAPVGGETCALYLPTSGCASSGGGADTDMAFSHYSFLHIGYNKDVNDVWATQGCIEEIKRRLGYRLQLVSGLFRTEAQPGQAIPLTLEFQNTGYAALFNPRGLELVLRHSVTGQKYFAQLSRDTDARWWLPGMNWFLSSMVSLSPELPLGNYELLLHLPDPTPSLYGILPYSIRLANSNALSSAGTVLGDVWEPATGYHRLRHTLTVNSTATNSPLDGTEIPVLDYSAILVQVPVSLVDPTQPANLALTAGQPAAFGALAAGSAPLRYQWLKNGLTIPGATNTSFTIASVQATDAGAYSAQIRNPLGVTNTRSALLTVTTPPSPLIQIDGSFEDWQSLAPLYSSPSNSPAATNLKDIYVANDAGYLYVMVTAWSPARLLASTNNFCFDTDNNAATGYSTMGGSELLLQNGLGYQQKAGDWNAGDINGLQYLGAPAGTASQFEFRLSRFATNASDGSPVFKTNVISFCFDGENAAFHTVNRLPPTGTLHYTLVEPPPVPPGPLAISCSGRQVTISWPGSGTVQTRDSLTSGSWTNVPSAAAPFTLPATGAQQYFRLAQ